LSFPRIDVHEGRPRVPSFYALEAVRAAEGELPSYEDLAQRAESAVAARIGWPAPKDPSLAIDDAERDLSVLYPLFHDRSGASLVGRARYLVQVNPYLSRALRRRYARSTDRWNASDGLLHPSAEALEALAHHRLDRRSFSATALQHFASCPYKFFLSALLRLSPRDEPASIEELDPLQRGSMVHEVQYRVMSALRDEAALPLKPEARAHALATVDRILDEVAREQHELYHPAIERIWLDGIEAIRADVRKWMNDAIDSEKAPWRFELAFGLPHRAQEDPDSRREPVQLDGGLCQRGSIDRVERTPQGRSSSCSRAPRSRAARCGTAPKPASSSACPFRSAPRRERRRARRSTRWVPRSRRASCPPHLRPTSARCATTLPSAGPTKKRAPHESAAPMSPISTRCGGCRERGAAMRARRGMSARRPGDR
jgi:hypothetical protein